MNTKLLLRIKKRIMKDSDHFDMSWWFQSAKDDNGHLCGTAACIAGWAVVLGRRKSMQTVAISPSISYDREGRQRLGLNDQQGNRLFGLGFWPMAFRTAYNAARSNRERALVAAQRIDHFIKTEGRE